jgi:hypothetical protein
METAPWPQAEVPTVKEVIEQIESGDIFSSDGARILINMGYPQAVANLPEKYENLGNDIAESLIESGYGAMVVDYPEKFPGVNLDKTLALNLVTQGGGQALLMNLDKFTPEVTEELALAALEANGDDAIIKNYLTLKESGKLEARRTRERNERDRNLGS